MAMYRVWASYSNDCYLDVEADSKEEAEQIAEEADGGDFIPCDSFDDGDWHICYDSTEELLDKEDEIMDRGKVIELVKALDITAEELGIQPEVKPDEVFVQNVKEFIEQYSSKEKAKEFFSNEYYELLGFKEEKKYKLVELQLTKTIYKNVQVILDMDESTNVAFCKGSDYADFDNALSVDNPDDEDYWEEDNVSVIDDDLTRSDITYRYDPEVIWNYEEIEED